MTIQNNCFPSSSALLMMGFAILVHKMVRLQPLLAGRRLLSRFEIIAAAEARRSVRVCRVVQVL